VITVFREITMDEYAHMIVKALFDIEIKRKQELLSLKKQKDVDLQHLTKVHASFIQAHECSAKARKVLNSYG